MGNGEKKLIHTLHVRYHTHVVHVHYMWYITTHIHVCSTCTVPSTHIRLCTHA